MPEGELDRRRELLLVVHLRDADRGAEPRGLDEHGVAERVLDRVAEPDRVVRRDRDAAVAHDLLEQVLVHRERGRCDAGADVGDVGELEQPLHRAVLAERAVQDAGGRRPRRPASRASRSRPGRAASPQDRASSSGTRTWPALQSPASVAADRDLGDLVPLRVESRGDRARRRQGDLVLARAAAREDGHAETARPSSRAGRGRRRRWWWPRRVLADHDRHRASPSSPGSCRSGSATGRCCPGSRPSTGTAG